MEANVNDLFESIEGILNERIKVLKQYSHNNSDYLDGVEDTYNAIMDVIALERDLYID